jgi:hypothetical protein
MLLCYLLACIICCHPRAIHQGGLGSCKVYVLLCLEAAPNWHAPATSWLADIQAASLLLHAPANKRGCNQLGQPDGRKLFF